MEAERTLCCVLLPNGAGPDSNGRYVDFNAVHTRIVQPALDRCSLEAHRSSGYGSGFLQSADLEAILLSRHLIADLSRSDPSTYYCLGLRHALRRHGAIAIAAEGVRLGLDRAGWDVLRYELDAHGAPMAGDAWVDRLVRAIEHPTPPRTDDTLVALLDGVPPLPIERLKTDVFRDSVTYPTELRIRLATARADRSVEALAALRDELRAARGGLSSVRSEVLVDLLLSFRALSAWEPMSALHYELPLALRETVLVREQHAFALNRLGRSDEAERILRVVLRERGPSSETCGLLGRVLKDRWERARNAGSYADAQVLLKQAIDAYREGFEADWRDAYPGINVVTLMELCEPPDSDREKLLPIVRYAAERRITSGKSDYWDHATLLELAVLAVDKQKAREHLARALTSVRERWEPETTARNLRLVFEAREARGGGGAWLAEVVRELERRATSRT